MLLNSIGIRIGTAGWSIPRLSASRFDSAGTHLQRYAKYFSCAEINSSFYRPHAVATYAKWRDSTPPHFRFSVKMPRAITHDLKLTNAGEALLAFLAQTEGLAEKRGPLLMQLPPSFAFDATIANTFLEQLRAHYEGPIVCEPRHATWFSRHVASLLDRYRVARVVADPPPTPAARLPGGYPELAYFRLHGSPRTYWSKYDEAAIALLAGAAGNVAGVNEVWFIFDNTASGAAIENAWNLSERVNGDPDHSTSDT